jgi:hypothetical protein
MSKRQGRASDLGVLILIMASYTLTLLSSIVIVVNARVLGSAYPEVAIGGVYVNKLLSVGLSIMAYIRIRKRKQSTARHSQSFKRTKRPVKQTMSETNSSPTAGKKAAGNIETPKT